MRVFALHLRKKVTLVEVIILYVFYLLSVKFVVSIILPVISPYFLFLQVVNDCLKKYIFFPNSTCLVKVT